MFSASLSTFAVILLHMGLLKANSVQQQQYIGCYRDGGGANRVMIGATSLSWTNMTLEICSSYCMSTSNTYFGVVFWYECYCADQYFRLGRTDDSFCNTPCAGNHSQTCGGIGTLSVYTVCPVGFSGRNCDFECHCLNNVHCYRNRTCPGGLCAAGWTGTGGLCQTDIDECATNNGGCNQKCHNSPGSYNCSCDSTLFTLNSNGLYYDDIDECLRNNGDCEHLCDIWYGGYICSCTGTNRDNKPGFVLNDDNKSCETTVSILGVVTGVAIILLLVVSVRHRRLAARIAELEKQINNQQHDDVGLEPSYANVSGSSHKNVPPGVANFEAVYSGVVGTKSTAPCTVSGLTSSSKSQAAAAAATYEPL